jgi:hypothetical protein
VLAAGLAACTSTPPTSEPAASGAAPTTAQSDATVQWSADPTAPTSPTVSPEQQWREGVVMAPQSLPAEMTLSADRIDLGGLVGPAGDRPAATAAVRTQPNGHRELQVSTWDGVAWQPHAADTGVAGDPQGVEIAGGATGGAALAGWSWESGRITPFLLTSADRSNWSAVDLPESLDGYRLLALDVSGDRVVAVGQDARGAAVVTVASADPTIVTDLPPDPDRRSRFVIDVAAVGDTLLVITGRDANHNGPPRVQRSTDGGRTWADPTPVTDSEWARVDGVTAVTGGFLATGADRVDEASNDRRATAWFSADGIAWQAQALPEPDGFRTSGDDSRAGTPSASGADAFTVVASDSAVAAQVFARRATGEWVALGSPPDEIAAGFGFGGSAAPAGTDPTGPVLVGIDGALGTTFGQLAGGAWATVSATANTQEVTTFRSAVAAEPQVWRADVQRAIFEQGPSGWQRGWGLNAAALTGDTLAIVAPDPPEASLWTLRGYSGSAEVALVSDFVQQSSKLAILGWFRPAPDQPWTPTTGFGSDPWEQASAAGHVGGLWLVAGGRQAQISRDLVEQAMIWYSTDGITWARAEGDFAQEDRASRIVGFCAAPDGRRAAVGYVTTAKNERNAALWIEQEGHWQRAELPTDAGRTSAFATCVEVAGTLVINGSLGAGTRQWSWAPDGGFTELDPPSVDRSGTREFRNVTAVPGGYLAVGRLDATAYTGPVIWLSADGDSWTWLPLPVNRPDAGALASAIGNDLLVMTSSTTSSQAWRIRDIATVIAALPAES